jgi:DNA excision repair protein ERCC-2
LFIPSLTTLYLPPSQREIENLKQTDAARLNDEYARLVNGLASTGALPANEELPANPLLPHDILMQAVPGNLRRADTFVVFLKRFAAHVKKRMQTEQVCMCGKD